MKLRGTTGGLNLLIEASDTPEALRVELSERSALLAETVDLELAGVTSWAALLTVAELVESADGIVRGVRPAREPRPEAHAEALVAAVDRTPNGTATSAVPQAAANAALRTDRLEIITRTLRSGTRREVSGSVIVLGDVNPGVELIAGGDVIIVGTLRGLAHAGSGGRTDAIIYANRIAATQVRVAHALARAPEGSSFKSMQSGEADGPEIARLEGDQIIIEPYSSR